MEKKICNTEIQIIFRKSESLKGREIYLDADIISSENVISECIEKYGEQDESKSTY